MASPIADQCAGWKQATFWDTHRSSCSGELRQATDRFALVDEIIEVVHDQAREVQFAGDNGVVDNLQDEADDNDNAPLPESKIRPILREVVTLQSSLVAKVSVDAAMLCLPKQGQPSPGFV